ncbi:hypothetical protein [Actinoallomurus iriomotensis]|uniref:Uncharacterized protein n=1 Tax=Actinoallomurus iriomotensis TaxID=478107 RepID=A0A9W6VX85_9ACTN|nr:hypothetical protein [Actinoallomurus iriomotensis]GLY82387.1 hypothetical protein Airi02_003190 [Actinoallomurus iriomotensis]
MERYAGEGRVLDLVAQYQSHRGDVAGYTGFVRRLVRDHGHRTATLQVGEEPNVPGNPTLDGYYPNVRPALVEGVLAADDEARRQGFDHLRVGFDTTPLFGPAEDFVASLTDHGGTEFTAALGYVGLDFFQPVPPEKLHGAAIGLLRSAHSRRHRSRRPAAHHRERPARAARPSGRPRSWRRPSPRSPAAGRSSAASAYTHFALRDADSSAPGLFHNFGLLTDDYRPKPAFAAYQALIERFG